MTEASALQLLRTFVRRLFVGTGAVGMTLGFFLVLPLMQAITKAPETDLVVQSLDTADIPPPPPPPEEEPEEEPEPEEQPPELAEEQPLLDLSQLELALGPSIGEGWLGGDFALKLDTVVKGNNGGGVEELFAVADLDQKPRAVYQPSPVISAPMRKKAPGTVYVLFVVDPDGKVEDPVVQKSTDPVFERAALAAVKQWRFEPGKRKGQSVRFRMRVPITFPKE